MSEVIISAESLHKERSSCNCRFMKELEEEGFEITMN